MAWLLIGLVLTLSAWVYSDAKERGSSAPALWAIAVLFLTIICLPLYLICRPSRYEIRRFGSEKYLCPHCGLWDDSIHEICPRCHQKIEAWEINPPSTDDKKYKCPKCGKFYSKLSNHCRYCGAELWDIKEYRE